jgi:hypothetical protein
MDNNKSTFVTVVAWIFIVGSGFTTLVSLMQNVMFHVMFKKEEFSQATQDMPPTASFMFENMQLIVMAFLLVCIVMLASSIGLLKRKNWARLVFIVLLSLGIAWSLGSILLQTLFLSSIPEVPQGPQFEEFQTMRLIMQWFTAIIGIGVTVLFAWIIKKLISGPIKQEFTA